LQSSSHRTGPRSPIALLGTPRPPRARQAGPPRTNGHRLERKNEPPPVPSSLADEQDIVIVEDEVPLSLCLGTPTKRSCPAVRSSLRHSLGITKYRKPARASPGGGSPQPDRASCGAYRYWPLQSSQGPLLFCLRSCLPTTILVVMPSTDVLLSHLVDQPDPLPTAPEPRDRNAATSNPPSSLTSSRHTSD
jgi:hypothetical protein